MNGSPTLNLHVALGLVVDGSRALFIRRHDPLIPEYDERLEIPGGKVEAGEHPADAACREVLEETGYSVVADMRLPNTYHAEFPQKDPPISVTVECWLCSLRKEEQPALPIPAEQTGVWHRLDRLPFSSIIPGSLEFALWASRALRYLHSARRIVI